MYAKVIVDISHPNVDRVFDYAIPDSMPDLSTGMRVLVPFGSKQVEGFVIGVTDQTEFEEEKIKAILQPLEEYGAFTEEQLQLAEYMKERYNTTLAAALRLMIPAMIRGGRVSAKTQNWCFLDVESTAYEDALCSLRKADGTPKFPKQIEVLEALNQAGGRLPVAELGASPVKSLEKKGYIRIERVEIARVPFDREVARIDDYTLTPTQQTVLEQIGNGEAGGAFLLHGVTGSGKTEVYIRVIQDCLKQGQTAILLIPEISLTPQTYVFLKQRFDEPIAVFHSGLSAGERFDEWKKVKLGQARIVLGARSAVFAPLENLGVIIIDEQHEGSYKADNYPKYVTQEIAKRRCEINGAKLILGSATPDIETYYAAKQGMYTLLQMPERLFGLQMPEVTVVDMREELKGGNRSPISAELYRRMDMAFQQGKQVMLFLNRRGYATFVMCRSCGYTVKCDACDVTLTYHKPQDSLRCHYCGRVKAVQKICPECGKPYLHYFGTGTQQVEEQVQALFPQVRIIRMDHDTMQTKDAPLVAFEQFAAREADVLIGTQMITKGFDFENVSVSAILAADTMLNIPDYRSAEYTFSQITQIAGRSGRKEPGSVILQTYNPEHYAIRYAAQHDYEGFYEHEIALRRIGFLPPFTQLVQIQFAGEKEELVVAAVKDFLTKLKGVLLPHKNDIISVKASESAIKRINHQERYHVLINLKQNDRNVVDDVFRLFSETKYKNVLSGIDINPMGFA